MASVPRIAAVLTIDVSGELDNGSYVGARAWGTIWRALSGAEPGWAIRIDIGKARLSGLCPVDDDTMTAIGSLTVTGSDPQGISRFIAALRAA